ncbi:MAG: DUF2064 domain-containing protein, partial [bacterium]|nr:DUF2064 domain-containing protein [bacterium]
MSAVFIFDVSNQQYEQVDMTNMNQNKSVIAICIQEPVEDGTNMDLGAIQGDDLRFLHQAFITDTVRNASKVTGADIRLYHIDESERKRLVKIVTEYLNEKSAKKKTDVLKDRFSLHPMERERWGIRIEKVFKECFENGYENVIVVGSRTPTYSAKMMQATLRMLEKSDVVFGPTPEGRYYT